MNQELNPNCWKRNQNGEIKTPLSLIIKLCSEEITENKKEVLIKLLKHKDLDFSQMKSTPAIEGNPGLKQIIEQAITEQLTDAINRKDLDDVKKLVEDNCFMNHAIVTAALSGVDKPIKKYLNERFPANVEQSLPEDFEQVFQEVVITLERTESQLAETEQELSSVKQKKLSQQTRIDDLNSEITQLTKENAQFRVQNKSLSDKNKEPSEASAQGGSYASTFFVLSGAFTIGACLAVNGYPVIGACLAAVALGLFLLGCFSLYKANKRAGGTTDNPQATRVLISSPNSVESFYTY